MEDIPQPSSDAYTVGDRVKIYLDSSDPDAQYHGMVCEVLEVLADDLDAETERPIDSYSYILRGVETDEELPISFRHRDLIPLEST